MLFLCPLLYLGPYRLNSLTIFTKDSNNDVCQGPNTRVNIQKDPVTEIVITFFLIDQNPTNFTNTLRYIYVKY